MNENLVERRARIFRFGEYPKKGYAVTRDQFVAANGETGTIPIGFDPKGLKHYRDEFNALDGKTGVAEFSVEGDEVFATTRMPSWLDEIREELGLKVSSVIGGVTHVLRKIDLVDTPHIPDAVFFAEEHGDVALFDDDEPAEFVAAEEPDHAPGDGHDFAQQHHEVIAGMAHHAGLDFCHPSGEPGRAMHGPGHKIARALRTAHDHCVTEGGAYCPGMDQHQHEEVGMSDETETTEEETAEFAEETPREKALRLRLERTEAKLAENEAIGFADSVTKGEGRRAYPAERNFIVEGYRRAAAVDARLGEDVEFSDDKGTQKGSHVDAYKASILARPRIAAKAEETVGFTLDQEPARGAKTEAELAAEDAQAFEDRVRKLGKSLNGSR